MDKKKYKVFLVIILFLLLFVAGCFDGKLSQNDDRYIELNNKGIFINEIDISKLKDKELMQLAKDETLENGVYGYSYADKNRFYIFFNGVDSSYNNILFSLDNNALTIVYETQHNKDSRNISLFLIEKKSEDSFDTIALINNNKNDHFATIYVH